MLCWHHPRPSNMASIVCSCCSIPSPTHCITGVWASDCFQMNAAVSKVRLACARDAGCDVSQCWGWLGFFVMAMRVSVISENPRHAFHTVCFSNWSSADTMSQPVNARKRGGRWQCSILSNCEMWWIGMSSYVFHDLKPIQSSSRQLSWKKFTASTSRCLLSSSRPLHDLCVFSLILYSALATAIAVSRHYNHSLV